MTSRVVVLGAGPTGLGCAHRLAERGHADWDIYEAAGYVGGLAASETDPEGFIWDHGGHVMFSHYPYVDELIARMLGEDREEHVRQASVFIHGRLVPYPIQHNIHRLPSEVFTECRDGILAAQATDHPSETFAEWIAATFGEGLAHHFMRPYNEKVWAHPLEEMGVTWQGERVPDVDVARIDANHAANRDDAGWGPNATFSFPALGTGLLFERIAAALPRAVNLGRRSISVDAGRRTVTFADGTSTGYDHLVSTIPLTELVRGLDDAPPELSDAARSLRHTSGIFVGIGVRGEVPPERCWVYYPDPDVPFYRVTYLSNYARRMTPRPGLFSLLAEISVGERDLFPVHEAIDRTVDAMVRVGLLTEDQARHDVVSRHVMPVRHSYPVPTLGRDAALATIQEWLAARSIRSRGRFGAWRYEIGNTDHSLMMGVEAADAALDGTTEAVWTST